MPVLTDVYDFTLKSTSKQMGFNTFQHTDKNHYFLYNDKTGVPFLFSQPYTTEKSRDNGIHSVLKNSTIKKRYTQQKNEDGAYFFTLKAGNHLEIARSCFFTTKKEMLEKMKMLQAKNKGSVSEEKGNNLVKTQNTIPDSEHMESNSIILNTTPRYSYRITLYPQDDAGLPLKGKIEHPFSKTSQNFEGIDTSVITNFMAKHLPSEGGNLTNIPPQIPNENIRSATKSHESIAVSPISINLKAKKKQVRLIEKKPVPNIAKVKKIVPPTPIIPRKRKIENLEIIIPNRLKLDGIWKYRAVVSARSLTNSKKITFGNFVNHVRQRKIILPLEVSILSRGKYQIKVDVGLIPVGKNNQAKAAFFSDSKLFSWNG